MNKRSLLHHVDLPFCQVLMLEEWNAPPGRFFVAYRAQAGFSKILGQGVIDEFRTISAPILVSPAAMIGGIYDAGMLLADERNVEAPIDQGWPPLTIGIDAPAPDRHDDWRSQLLGAIKSQKTVGKPPWSKKLRTVRTGEYQADILSCETSNGIAAQFIVCNAPLLPQQLQRLADIGNAPITVAISTGNRLPRVSDGIFHEVDVVSESQLAGIIQVVSESRH